jgi:hypothetical protein
MTSKLVFLCGVAQGVPPGPHRLGRVVGNAG